MPSKEVTIHKVRHPEMFDISQVALIRRKEELDAELMKLGHSGTVEIKTIRGRKYLYVRKRKDGKAVSEYVNRYSDELYDAMKHLRAEELALQKKLRPLMRTLKSLGYKTFPELGDGVVTNIEFAKSNIKYLIYSQAVLEGIEVDPFQVDDIIESGKIKDMRVRDALKIINLKRAWHFIIDTDIIGARSDLSVLSEINRLVNDGLISGPGILRFIPVKITGTDHRPEMVTEQETRDEINSILSSSQEPIDTAISLALYVMKRQLFNDGNKRTGIIFANHYLIGHGGGLLIVPSKKVKEVRKRLVAYYEDDPTNRVADFMKKYCWYRFDRNPL